MKKYRVFLLPSAYEDIKQARQWYRQHNTDLPKKFKQRIQETIERICNAPFAYAARYKDVRLAHLATFPYAVHFLVDETNCTVVILAIHHTAISPDKWPERLK